MARAALFAVTGALWALDSLFTVLQPGYREPVAVGNWPRVLLFSAVIFALAFALPALARWISGRIVVRTATVVSAGAALAGVSNIFEDGLGWGWAFWPFVLGTAVIVVGLLVLTVAIALTSRLRLLAVVPAACLVDVLILHEFAGGFLVLVVCLVAATMALIPHGRPAPRTTSPSAT